jgi:hypothetical protein
MTEAAVTESLDGLTLPVNYFDPCLVPLLVEDVLYFNTFFSSVSQRTTFSSFVVYMHCFSFVVHTRQNISERCLIPKTDMCYNFKKFALA